MSDRSAANRPAQHDPFTDPATEFAAAQEAVRDGHWQIARVRRFVHSGHIPGWPGLSLKLSQLETRLAHIAVELEKLERRRQ